MDSVPAADQPRGSPAIVYRVSAPVTNQALNALFAASWPDHRSSDLCPALRHSLAYICAYQGDRLVGFVNMAWDGGIHAFILDTTVRPELRRRGIGRELVRRAADVARRDHGIEWLHVDYAPHLQEFYRQCGFRHTEAGVMRLD